jgi:hypothetical protein
MLFWSRNRTCIGLFLSIATMASCGGGGTPSPPPDTSKAVQPEAKTAQVQEPEKTVPQAGSPTNVPGARGVVLANRELGMMVSGQGSGNPTRSLDVLERQVITLLPDVREVYERARAQEPGLMGSLDVNMTVEANGGVSDVRFPVKRVSNDHLTSAVFDQLRGWTFPPDDLPIQLRFTLLFIPPEMDETSILLWEKRLGSRPVIEKVGEAPTPVGVATATSPEKQAAGETTKPHHEGKPTPLQEAVAPHPQQSATSGRTAAGWYRILQPTVLRADPDLSSRAVAGLRQGLRIRVVGVVKGQWLEVRSVNNRPSGFLRLEDATLERVEKAGRK